MTIVVDASIATKWFFEETGFWPARAVLDRGEALIAPSLVLIEVSNAAWKRYRRGDTTRDNALEVTRLAARPFSKLTPVEDLVQRAAEMALDLKHPIYDCLYLSLALHESVALVTAHKRLGTLGKNAGVDVELLR